MWYESNPASVTLSLREWFKNNPMDHKNITSILAEDTDGSNVSSLSSSAGMVLNIATITCIGVVGFVIGVGISKFVSKTLGSGKPSDHDDVEDFSQTSMNDPPQCHLETAHQAAFRLMTCNHGAINPIPTSSTRSSMTHNTHTTLSTREDTDIAETPPSVGLDIDPGVAAYRPQLSRTPTPQPGGLRSSRDLSYRLIELRKSTDVRKSTDDGQLLRRSVSADPDDEYHHIRKESV